VQRRRFAQSLREILKTTSTFQQTAFLSRTRGRQDCWSTRQHGHVSAPTGHCASRFEIGKYFVPKQTQKSDIALIDFDRAVPHAPSNDPLMRAQVGTNSYMAPEIQNLSGYTRKCDIWSIGIIVHALLSGAKAPVFEDPETTHSLEFSDKNWNGISEMAKDFI
jgi:serine/threonine protein kinase